MQYWIDGYNLLFRLIDPQKSFHSERETIIHSLQIEFAALGLRGLIFFDATFNIASFGSVTEKSPLIIVYSPRGVSADQYILEKLSYSAEKTEITVVTDDRPLGRAAKRAGVHIFLLQDFFRYLQKKREAQKLKPEQKKHSRISPRDRERWVLLFEKRLHQQPNEND